MDAARDVGEVRKRLGAMESYGLATAAELRDLQAQADAEARRAYERSSVASLSYDTAMADAHDALTGLLGDLSGASERTRLWDMVTHNDRMRGLGILLMALALVGLVVDYIMM